MAFEFQSTKTKAGWESPSNNMNPNQPPPLQARLALSQIRLLFFHSRNTHSSAINAFLHLFRTRQLSQRLAGIYRRIQGPCATASSPIARFSPYPRTNCMPSHFDVAMSTSRLEFEYIEDVERFENYQPGGYHPISIDDRLHDRYRIIHKLSSIY